MTNATRSGAQPQPDPLALTVRVTRLERGQARRAAVVRQIITYLQFRSAITPRQAQERCREIPAAHCEVVVSRGKSRRTLKVLDAAGKKSPDRGFLTVSQLEKQTDP